MRQKHLEKYRKKLDSQKESDRKQEGLLHKIVTVLFMFIRIKKKSYLPVEEQ